MKVERLEEETDEEWSERLAEEIAVADNTDTTQHFVGRDPYNEKQFIINYVGEGSRIWKEHPKGPFSCEQVLGWKKNAEKWAVTVSRVLDEEMPINPERLALGMDVLNQHFDSCETLEEVEEQIEDLLDSEDKLEAVSEWVERHGNSLGIKQHNWDELHKILEAVDVG